MTHLIQENTLHILFMLIAKWNWIWMKTHPTSPRSHSDNRTPWIRMRIIPLSTRQLHAVVPASNSINQIIKNSTAEVFPSGRHRRHLRPLILPGIIPLNGIQWWCAIRAPNGIQISSKHSNSNSKSSCSHGRYFRPFVLFRIVPWIKEFNKSLITDIFIQVIQNWRSLFSQFDWIGNHVGWSGQLLDRG